jgi:hypothetical protein
MVGKTLIDNGASLNFIMRKIFIEMGLTMAELTSVHDTFHDVIPDQLSTPIGRIDLEVSCGSGNNKHREILTFEVASFDIRYNYILRRLFLLKFMTVIHTAYATIKMLGPKGVITIKVDQRVSLACKNRLPRHPKQRVVVLLANYWRPNHRSATLRGSLQRRKALILHQPLLHHPPIRRWTIS